MRHLYPKKRRKHEEAILHVRIQHQQKNPTLEEKNSSKVSLIPYTSQWNRVNLVEMDREK